MNGLEKLVPILPLCKQIPAGEFDDSALVHIDCYGQGWDVVERRMIPRDEPMNFPAPTLKEIMVRIYGIDCFSVSAMKARENGGGFNIAAWMTDQFDGYSEGPEIYDEVADKNDIESAALRLWLRLRKEVDR